MHSVRRLSAAAVTTVLLAACTAGPSQTQQPSETPHQEPATPTTSAPTTSAATTTAAATPTETPTPTAPATNADGYLVKKLGDTGKVLDGNGTTVVTFTVIKINKNVKCTSGYADKPKNGHYIALLMDVTTTKDIGGADVPYFNTDQWALVGPDGLEENDTAGNAWSCLAEADHLPNQIERPMHRRGWVVLDVAHTTGSLRLSQDYIASSSFAGWEYPL